MTTDAERLHDDNLRLSRLEYEQRNVYLYSRPRCLSLVLGNACNIDCPHCYQAKNGDNLLRPAEIAEELRRELMAFYPYVSTLRIQGGEVFAIRGFRELIEDVAQVVRRPILSISTNGTLIDDQWAERLVRTPFSNVTVSIDGGTRATYNRLRKGADLDQVLSNIDCVQGWKAKLRSDMPYLDSFFVIMRSNFREIPQYLELMQQHGMISVALQTMELSLENTARMPTLEADEAISDRREVEDLHAILRDVLPQFQKSFRAVRVSGLQTLFETHGLSATFLEEGEKSLYPDSDGLSEGAFELCPNPWTTLFLAENGDAYLCFISQPIGNLYAESLSSVWNSPERDFETQRHDCGTLSRVRVLPPVLRVARRQVLAPAGHRLRAPGMSRAGQYPAAPAVRDRRIGESGPGMKTGCGGAAQAQRTRDLQALTRISARGSPEAYRPSRSRGGNGSHRLLEPRNSVRKTPRTLDGTGCPQNLESPLQLPPSLGRRPEAGSIRAETDARLTSAGYCPAANPSPCTTAPRARWSVPLGGRYGFTRMLTSVAGRVSNSPSNSRGTALARRWAPGS